MEIVCGTKADHIYTDIVSTWSMHCLLAMVEDIGGTESRSTLKDSDFDSLSRKRICQKPNQHRAQLASAGWASVSGGSPHNAVYAFLTFKQRKIGIKNSEEDCVFRFGQQLFWWAIEAAQPNVDSC